MTERAHLPELNDDEKLAREYFRVWLREQRERKRLETEIRLAIATLSSIQTLRKPTHTDMLERIRVAVAQLKTAVDNGV